MSCEALQSIAKTCDNNTGGIKTVWIGLQEDFDVTTIVDWGITAWTVSSPTTVYAINRNTGNYTEETAQDLLNGSTLVTQTITLMFNRRDKAKSESINILGGGQRYLAVVIQDANDKYWYFENVQLTATGEGSGTARADGSKYSVTLLAEADHLAYEVLSTLVTGHAGDFPLPTQA
jgi:hypothetical protein